MWVSISVEMLSFPEDGNPVTVLAGAGAVRETYRLLDELDADRAMIVCGQTVGRLGTVRELMTDAPVGVEIRAFDQVEPDPTGITCQVGGTAARELGAHAIIGIGGGSSMDAAKAIAAEAVVPGWTPAQDHPGRPAEMDFDPLPTILVPTTAGTASEVTPFSVITYADTKRKLVLNHPKLYARYALLDPTMLLTCSKQVRMATGMDALTHAIESCVSKQATDQTRRRALEAIALIAPHLPRVVADKSDMEAQQQLQLGAMIAGLAFAKSRLGIVHAMALPLSALFHVPHGEANAVLLPYGMRFNVESAPEGFAAVAAAMGVDTSRMAPGQAAMAAVEAVGDISRTVGAPTHMSELGVTRDAIPQMADDAMPSAHIACNPRAVEKQDVIELYNLAF